MLMIRAVLVSASQAFELRVSVVLEPVLFIVVLEALFRADSLDEAPGLERCCGEEGVKSKCGEEAPV